MKPKRLFILFVLLNLSCKVTEKSILGFYQSKKNHFNTLKLNADHTFLYSDFDIAKWLKQIDIDTCHFITRGKWILEGKKLMLNSYTSAFADTARLIKIVKTQSLTQRSNFSFEDIDGNLMYFYRIDDEKSNVGWIVDKDYTNFDVDIKKHQQLTFNFSLSIYRPWTFFKTDNNPCNYHIILAPYFKPAYFNNRTFNVKWNLITGNTYNSNTVVFEKKKSLR